MLELLNLYHNNYVIFLGGLNITMSSNVYPILSSSPPPMEGPVTVVPYPMLSSSPPPMEVDISTNDDDFRGFETGPSFNSIVPSATKGKL